MRVLVLACVLGTGTAGAAGPLRLEATPRQLLSGRDTRVVLELTGANAPGEVKLACSAGRVQPLKRTGPQKLQALFTPPRSDRVAPILCAAVAPASGAHALVVLELQRRQVLPLTGLPPLSRVEVDLGGTHYGPVRANAAGQAEVAVLLTPAVAQATVSATPPGGPEQRSTWPLPVSSEPVLLLMQETASLQADGEQGTRVWAFSVDAQGSLRDLPVALTPTGGKLELRRSAPGVQTGLFVPLPRIAAGEASLTARVGSAPPSALRVALKAGVQPILSLEAPTRELLSDGDSGTDITVYVRDAQGRGLPALPVRLTAARGEVTPVVDQGDGSYLARYRTPKGGTGEVPVIAMLTGAASSSLTLLLRPPPRLVLASAARELPADGFSRVGLRLIARDATGLPVPDGTEVALSSSLGTVPASVRTREGSATFELVADRKAGEALIQARLPDVDTRASVRLLPGAPARLRVRAEHPSVQCNGRDTTQVYVLVQDAHGNPLEEALPLLSAAGSQAERGQFERVAALGRGEFVTLYRPPTRCEGGEATLLAAAGEARGDARLTLTPRTPLGLTLRLGAQSNLGRLLMPTVELEGDARPYALGERLAASFGLQVSWGQLELGGQTAGGGPFQVQVRPLLSTASAGARWHLPLTSHLTGYAGAGVDLHLASITYRLSLLDEERQHLSLVAGGHARLGLTLTLGPGELVLQGRFGLARLPESAPFRGTLGGLSGSLGYRLPL
jgi:hypothetical protein